MFEFGAGTGRGTRCGWSMSSAVAYDPSTGLLTLADTYNNKIKRMDPATAQTVTVMGGAAGVARDAGLGPAFEPAGLSVADGKLYVVDTSNHAIRELDPTRLEVSTLEMDPGPYPHE